MKNDLLLQVDVVAEHQVRVERVVRSLACKDLLDVHLRVTLT